MPVAVRTAGRWRPRSVPLALVVLVASASWAGPGDTVSILVLPAGDTPSTRPLVLQAEVRGAAPDARVTLFWAGEHETVYRPVAMAPRAGAVVEAIVPAADERGAEVSYFVEVARDGREPVRAGEPHRPFVARLIVPEPATAEPDRSWAFLAPGAVLAAATLLVLRRLARARRRDGSATSPGVPVSAPAASPATLATPALSPAAGRGDGEVDRFWYRLVVPLLELPTQELPAAARRLASFPQVHPDGLRLLEAREILDRVQWARTADPRLLGAPSVATRRETAAAGFGMAEMLVVLTLLGLLAGAAALNLRPLEAPLRTAAEEVEALFRQTRARALATTTPHRVRPIAAGALVVERSTSCAGASWDEVPALALELPREVGFDATAWSVCFDARGLASTNLTLTLSHPPSGQRRLEVLLGGTLRRLP